MRVRRAFARAVLSAIGTVSTLASCSQTRATYQSPEQQRVEVRVTPDGRPEGEYRSYGPGEWLETSGSYDGGGRKAGVWTTWDSQGVKIVELAYRDGLKNGPCRMWFSSHSGRTSAGRPKLEVSFVADRMQGRKTSWYLEGGRKCETQFAAGAIVAARCWDVSGAELSPDTSAEAASLELKADLAYLHGLDDTIDRTIRAKLRSRSPSAEVSP